MLLLLYTIMLQFTVLNNEKHLENDECTMLKHVRCKLF